jgi:hypothetical protein
MGHRQVLSEYVILMLFCFTGTLILVVNLKGRDYMGELDVNGRIINKWVTMKHDVTV